MRRRPKPLPDDLLPYPASFRLEEWTRPDDPIVSFGDEPTMRAIRRWLDACATWRYTEGRSITPTAEVPGTSLAVEVFRGSARRQGQGPDQVTLRGS